MLQIYFFIIFAASFLLEFYGGTMKILVVRFKQIGDSILASPMCNTLKKTFPDAEIDYVLYEHVSPIFKNHKYIDNVISITKEEQKNPFKYIAKV